MAKKAAFPNGSKTRTAPTMIRTASRFETIAVTQPNSFMPDDATRRLILSTTLPPTSSGSYN